MSYYELWAIMNSWRSDFSSSDFARTFPSPDPRKVLHDMAAKGLLEHLGYGKYRVRPMENYMLERNDVSKAYELLKESKYSYALTDVDGVFAWTKGGYNVGRFFGYYPIHLKVRRSDVTKWKPFLRKKGKKVFLFDQITKELLFGVFYVLHPKTKLEYDIVEGLRVEPLAETLEFANGNPYTYQPALEMLDQEYKLGLGTKYSE